MTAEAIARAGSLTPGDLAAVPAEAPQMLRGARRVLTVCHENPEADALGSALGVALLVEALGGTATPVCADPVPRMYRFMPQIERFRQDPDPDVDYDLIVVSDCGDLERTGSVLERHRDLFSRVPILDIDHHKSNPRFGAFDWVDASAAATCEMVTLLARVLDVPLDAAEGALASVLCAGLVIDTANFQHPNTTPRTLRVGAELLAAGAPLADIARLLYRTKPNEQLRLFGRVLARLETAADGRVCWSTLLDADVDAAGALPQHTEGLIDLLGQSETADVVLLFKEHGADTRVSVRTKEGGVDATELTGSFGGGGHARAAGATVALPLDAAIAAVLAEAERLIVALPGTNAPIRAA